MDFELDKIGNMYKVPLTFSVPYNKTVCIKASKIDTVKNTGHKRPTL